MRQISCETIRIGHLESRIVKILHLALESLNRPALVAVGGPGGTGKSSFCKRLSKMVEGSTILTLDDYKYSRIKRQASGLFGAHPDANDCALIREHLQKLRRGMFIDKPVYNPVSGEIDSTQLFNPTKVVLLDGEISTYEQFSDLIDFSIFIDSDWRTQLATRISRDIEVRQYTPEKAIRTFLQSNLDEFPAFGAKSREQADLVLFCRKDYSLQIKAVNEQYLSLLKSSHEQSEISGLITAVPTPFTSDGMADTEALLRHLAFLDQQGVSSILINGTTGEFWSLSQKEKKALISTVRGSWKKTLCVQVGDTGIGSTLELLEHAQQQGADAVFCLPPFYVPRLGEDDLIRYFQQVRNNCQVPLILYNHPFTNNPLTPGILKAIDHYGVKDSAGELLLAKSTHRYFTGKDRLIVESFQQGGLGFVSGYSSFCPGLYNKLAAQLKAGATDEALKTAVTVESISKLFSGEHQIGMIKFAISRVVPHYSAFTRPPLPDMPGQNRERIDLLLSGIQHCS